MKSAETEDYWLKTDTGDRLLQDFGEFDVATVDIIKVKLSYNSLVFI